MIPVTKPSMPKRIRLDDYLTGIYQREQLTNNGPLVRELSCRLEEYLGVNNLLLVSTGTIALQIAYRALDVGDAMTGPQTEAITTPFTFVATESSLRWVGIMPRFADICPLTFNLLPEKAATLISPATSLIVPVHVYGNPCDVDAFDEVASRHSLRVVYDAAHAFGIKLRGRSILNWGDVATLSFHATKVFHTIEGGAIVFKDEDAFERAREIVNFGFDPETMAVNRLGINAKLSEVHAAFGLALLDEIDDIIDRRNALVAQYREELPEYLLHPAWDTSATRNGSYMPVLFRSPEERRRSESALAKADIATRRYFSPCLGNQEELAELDEAISISERILCLPIYADMTETQVRQVTSIVTSVAD